MGWAQAHGIRRILIQPGRRMQNGDIESFNGKFRGLRRGRDGFSGSVSLHFVHY